MMTWLIPLIVFPLNPVLWLTLLTLCL